MKIHLTLFFLAFLTVLLFSCQHPTSKGNSQPTPTASADTLPLKIIPSTQLDTLVPAIIALSANDFYKNQPPAPMAFKDVKLNYIKKPSGEELYILCGIFVTSDQKETPFATVKNSDYEQWIGTNALTYCQESQEILYTKEDLATALKAKFDALNK
jgi:hypothetical protein